MKEFIEAGKAYIVEGRRDDKGQFLPDKIVPEEGVELRAQRYVKIVLNVEMRKDLDMKAFVIALNKCKGKAKLLLELHDNGESVLMCLEWCRVDPEKLRGVVRGVLPEGVCEIVAA